MARTQGLFDEGARLRRLSEMDNRKNPKVSSGLSNRGSDRCDDIVALCSEAWHRLFGQSWRIMAIGMRDWSHGF